MIYRIEIRLM